MGSPAFQRPIFEKTQSMPKRDMFDMFVSLSKESMPCVKSKPPLPTRSLRSLRAAVCSNSSALCLHHAHPFVTAAEKRPVSCREAEGLVTKLWFGDQELLQYIDCFSMTAAKKAFSLRGLEVGLPAFQPRMFSRCDELPKRDLFHMFVQGILLQRHSTHEEIRESVSVNY